MGWVALHGFGALRDGAIIIMTNNITPNPAEQKKRKYIQTRIRSLKKHQQKEISNLIPQTYTYYILSSAQHPLPSSHAQDDEFAHAHPPSLPQREKCGRRGRETFDNAPIHNFSHSTHSWGFRFMQQPFAMWIATSALSESTSHPPHFSFGRAINRIVFSSPTLVFEEAF
jgi:hypothetical protein